MEKTNPRKFQHIKNERRQSEGKKKGIITVQEYQEMKKQGILPVRSISLTADMSKILKKEVSDNSLPDSNKSKSVSSQSEIIKESDSYLESEESDVFETKPEMLPKGLEKSKRKSISKNLKSLITEQEEETKTKKETVLQKVNELKEKRRLSMKPNMTIVHEKSQSKGRCSPECGLKWKSIYRTQLLGLRLSKSYKQIVKRILENIIAAPSKDANTLSYLLNESVVEPNADYLNTVNSN